MLTEKNTFVFFQNVKQINKTPDGASTGVNNGTWKQQGQGCVPGHILPGDISIVPNQRNFADIVVGEFK